MKRSLIYVTALAVLVSLQGTANAAQWSSGTLEDGCKANMAKIAVQYEMSSLSEHGTARKAKLLPRALMLAEMDVQGGLGASRSEIQKRWPGFHDWAVLYVLRASENQVLASSFTTQAPKDCIAEFSSRE